MDYLLFTYPNCPRCDALKAYMNQAGVEYQEFNLTQRESKLRVREFLKILNRDEKGGIIIPTLIGKTEDADAAVINSREELQLWLKSKA